MQLLRKIGRNIAHLVYPQLCDGCRKPLLEQEQVLCLHCIQELPRTDYHHIPDNETAMRFAGRFPFLYATSMAYFTSDGLLQHLLHALKYEGRKDIGYFLGQQLGYDLLDAGITADVIVPVPLYKKKEAQRGYNQSSYIAEGIGYVLNIPVSGRGMQRTRHTESQTQKTREERVQNVSDAFTCSEDMAGRHVLLCDDVLTTGATLEACALALRRRQGTQVSLVTVGIAID